MPSSVNPANHPWRMREEKGKSIEGNDVPNIPVIERFEISLLPNPMVNRVEDETRGNFPREGTETKQLGMTAVTHSDEMPEVLRAKFLSSMLKAKMFTQKGQTITLASSYAKFPERTMVVKEQGPGTIMVEEQGNVSTISSSDVPSFHILVDTESLSDSDKETE
jgi:hypothetical protein